MSRFATEGKSGGGFKPEFGLHNVVCVQLVDFGTHDKEWLGKIIGQVNKVNIGFEFVDVDLEGDNGAYHPVWGQEFTNSIGKKSALRPLLEGWRGRAFTPEELKLFDLDKLLGLSCQLVIGPNENSNPKITSIIKAPNAFQHGRDLNSFWIDENWNGDIPEWLPEWMKENITNSYEFQALFETQYEEPPVDDSPDLAVDDMDEDIPF